MNRFVIIVLALLLLSCDDVDKTNGNNLSSFDKEGMINRYVDHYIKTSYDNYVNVVQGFKNSVEGFNQTSQVLDSVNLQCIRKNWLLVAQEWQKVAFLEFGPAAEIGLRAQTNAYPVDTTLINANIHSGSYSLASANNFKAKGIQALDYLLHQPGRNNSVMIGLVKNGPTHDYIKDLANDLLINALSVQSKWSSGDFSSTILLDKENNVNNGSGSFVSAALNAYSLHYEAYVRKGKVGLPSGKFNGFSQLELPAHCEAYYSGNSILLLSHSLLAMENFFKGVSVNLGSDGLGFDDYLKHINATKSGVRVDEAILAQYSIISNKLNVIQTELSSAVLNDKEAVSSLYSEMQKLVGMLKVDVTAALGVLIQYQDSDGD